MDSTERPKVKVEIESEVNEIYMKSKVIQEFKNNLKKPIELKVSIANNIPDLLFVSFTAKIGDSKVVKSKIIKDEKAGEKYTDAISEGNAAIYAKKCSKGNKYIIHFGNIPSNEKVIFISEFIQNTRYKKKFEIELFRNLPIFEGLLFYNDFNSNGKLEIKTQNKIIELEKHIENKNIQIIKESFQNDEQNNYLILYEIKTERVSSFFYQENSKSSKILFNIEYKQPLIYYQKLSKDSDEKIYSLLYKTKIVNNIELNPGLFIFLLDQSNSMRGEKRKIACNALKIFLQSIPKNSFYQIIGFGTKFKKYNENPVPYIKKNIEKSMKIIADITANMKGTNIYSPLEDIYNSEELKETINFPKAIFILTDGAISNKEKTLELIKKNNNKYSIYSIGLGKEFDKDLIKKAGMMGKGNSYFCSDVKNLTLITSKSINDFITSCHNNLNNIQNFKLTSSLPDKDILLSDDIPKLIDEDTKICINYLIKDKSQYNKINVNNEYYIGKEIIKKEYQITPIELHGGNELFKIIFHKSILEKENSIKNFIEYKEEKKEDIDYYDYDPEIRELFEFIEHEDQESIKKYNEAVKKENEEIKKENELIEKENASIIKEIVDLCLKYQILSGYTSLFAKVELKDKIANQMELVCGFQNPKNDIEKELDELNNFIISLDKKDVNKMRDLFDKFCDEYIDEIEALPEEKIQVLDSIEYKIENYEIQQSKGCCMMKEAFHKPIDMCKVMKPEVLYMEKQEEKLFDVNDFFKEYMNNDEKIDDKKEKEMKQLNNKMKLKESINLKKNIKIKENNKNKAMEIINTQDFLDGFWDINTKTETVKKKYENEFNIILGLNKKNDKINNKVVMTLLVIYYIYDEYPELVDEIIMIIKKGKLFIQNTCNESYEDLVKKARLN